MNRYVEQSEIDFDVLRKRYYSDVFDPLAIKALSKLDLKLGQSVLEIAPGSQQLLEWVATRVGQSGKIVAVNNNPYYDAKNFLESRNGLILNELVEAEELHKFDYIIARSFFLTDDSSSSTFDSISKMLKKEGVLLIINPDIRTIKPSNKNTEFVSFFHKRFNCYLDILKKEKIIHFDAMSNAIFLEDNTELDVIYSECHYPENHHSNINSDLWKSRLKSLYSAACVLSEHEENDRVTNWILSDKNFHVEGPAYTITAVQLAIN